MTEDAALKLAVCQSLANAIPKAFKVEQGLRLRYRALQRENGAWPDQEPAYGRGVYEYETDVAVTQQSEAGLTIPLVVVEVKGARSGATTHDVIVYSEKARSHRWYFPWLRYGFVSRDRVVPLRTILHGREFDFVIAVGPNSGKGRLDRLGQVVSNELAVAVEIRNRIYRGRECWEYSHDSLVGL